MKKIALVLTVLALTGWAGAGNAVPMIDQSQLSAPNYMAGFDQQDLAQSFQQTNDNIAGAGIFLRPDIGTSGTVTIELWDALPNEFGANLLTSGTGTGTQGSWFDVFWAPIAVTPATTYFLVFGPSTNGLGIAGDVNNPYSAGQTYANPGFVGFSTFDYTFRTYFESDSSASVPTPATLALFGLGLLSLGWSRRKKV